MKAIQFPNMKNPTLTFRLLDSFADPLIDQEGWNELAKVNTGYSIFITYQWQKIWWEHFGRGQLLLIATIYNEKVIALAPLFTESGMIFFTGSGGSDYLDFLGDIKEDGILEGMLNLAKAQVIDFIGFRFYHIPNDSNSHRLLIDFAEKNNWSIYDDNELLAPLLEINKFPELAHAATRKKSLLRHDAWFRKNGDLLVQHFHRSEEILPYLNEFFHQHISRWNTTPFPSLFLNQQQQLFYIQLCEEITKTGWLRFTRISFNGHSIAFHFGFNFLNNFLWYKPSFDILWAKKSPGEVLLLHLISKALEEEASIFDFGIGDEAFKSRFATHQRKIKTVELYIKE